MSLRNALAELDDRLDADQHRERYAAVADLIADEEKRRVQQVGDPHLRWQTRTWVL